MTSEPAKTHRRSNVHDHEAEARHHAWMRRHLLMGWSWGLDEHGTPGKLGEKHPTSPMLVPWQRLTEEQRQDVIDRPEEYR